MKVSKTVWGAAAACGLLIGMIGGAALLYAKHAGNDKADAGPFLDQSELARFAAGSLAALEAPAALKPAPAYVFRTQGGADARLADFRGRVVVLNVWAMWCVPCRTEMPTLARLATAYADSDLLVLPVNVDTGAEQVAAATAFIDAHPPLPLYSDPKFQLPFELPGKGKMPQTVLLDRDGRVRAYLSGEADWASAEARALIDALLAEGEAAGG
ncbi:MAG TPA: TlpA disulfide reductase family protein [Brevundimonas sp.]|nr:TlpA disulfide reductase family protein [Brevundimonas sp.]